MAKKSERKETWFKLIVLIVTGVIMWLWSYVTGVLLIVQWIIGVCAGTRNREIAEFIEYYSSTAYIFMKYMSGMSNTRPFPFTEIKRISNFEK